MKLMNAFRGLFSSKTTTVVAGSGELDTKSAIGYTIDMLAARQQALTDATAMQIEAFYSCIRDKAESIGQLPLKLYSMETSGRRQVMKGRTKRIFTERPNEYQTLQQFLEMVVVSLETNGAFYAYIARNDLGSVMEIIPFANQTGVKPNMDTNGNVYYTYVTNDGKPNLMIGSEELFIVSLFTTDGYTPVRPIYDQARLLGIANAQDDHYLNQTKNGITSEMALSTEQVFKDENAYARLKEQFQKMRGPSGLKETPIFEQGLKPVSLKLSPRDLELLGNKAFTVNRICRMTRVPLHRIGEKTDSGTKSTASELDEAYMRDSLNPVLVKIENEFNKFLPDNQRVYFDRKAFYAGSPWRLVEAVEREVKGGLASINEGRMDLGREPVEGGDVFAIDNNNVTYAMWTELKSIQEQLYGQTGNNGRNQEEPNNENQE